MALHGYLCSASAYGLQAGSTWGWNELPRFVLRVEPSQRLNPQLRLRLTADALDCACPLPAKKNISRGFSSHLRETSHALLNEHELREECCCLINYFI